MPPRNAIVFVLVVIAASAPARNEPSSSLKVTDVDVGLVDDRVDDGEVPLGVALGHLGDVARHQEADREDLVVLFVGEHGHVDLVVGCRARLQHRRVDVQVVLGAYQARDTRSR